MSQNLPATRPDEPPMVLDTVHDLHPDHSDPQHQHVQLSSTQRCNLRARRQVDQVDLGFWMRSPQRRDRRVQVLTGRRHHEWDLLQADLWVRE